MMTKAKEVPLKTATPEKYDNYDTVFISFSIWWGGAAWPVDNFVKGNDLTDKTVIPFCTSASLDIGDSGETLKEQTGKMEKDSHQVHHKMKLSLGKRPRYINKTKHNKNCPLIFNGQF